MELLSAETPVLRHLQLCPQRSQLVVKVLKTRLNNLIQRDAPCFLVILLKVVE